MNTMEKKAYSYYAFISYSRKDENWAKWLQKKLETYRIPLIIRKQNLNVPRKLYPVFRDKTDLTGGRLLEVLHEELDRSQYLIVICSPDSAVSPWVNKEILHFMQQGREAYVIPFIVSGEPMAENPEQECYPEALRAEPESEMLGISVKELGKEKAFLRVVAALLNLKFDQIVMRDRRRRRKQRAFAAAACLCLLTGGLAGMWYNMPHSAYYENFSYRYEIPEGIHPLSREERMGRAVHCRIVTRRGKVIRLEILNSAGKPIQVTETASGDSYAGIDFFYEGKQLSRAEVCDASGRLIFVKDYSSNLKAVDFQKSDDSSEAFTLSAGQSGYGMNVEGSPDGIKSEITRCIHTYDENGYLTERRFMRDNRNTPIADSNGNYGLRYEIDEDGQIKSVTGLDEEGNPHNSRYGYARYEFSYDENGRTTACEYFDADGKKVKNESGYCRTEVILDKFGNTICRKYLDEQGTLCNIKDGYAQSETTYTNQGFLDEVRLLDMNGNPAYSKSDGCHAHRYVYDEQGNLKRMEYLDAGMKPAYNSAGYASVEYGYDDEGRLEEEFCYGTDGSPVCEKNFGCFGMRYQWDEDGRLLCSTFVDADGEPMTGRYGYAMEEKGYYSDGNVQKESYYDTNGEAVCIRGNYASLEYEYDQTGKCIRVICRDGQGNRCMSTGGYGEIAYIYDHRGNLESLKYFDEGGNPVIASEGYHECRMEYDDHGNCVRVEYRDTDGNLQINYAGYAFRVHRYDEYGNELECSYYDEKGIPTQVEGISRICREYDSRGNIVQETKYPWVSETGEGNYLATVIVNEYDDRDNMIKNAFYDGEGQPRTDGENAAAYLCTYDSQNRMVYLKTVDAAGETSMEVKSEYNERNQLIRDFYYFPAEEPASGKVMYQNWYSYDEFGNGDRTEFRDAEGRLQARENGFAVKENRYNMTGDCIELAYYDENGKLCMYKEGYARLKAEYDPQGNRIREIYFDQNDNVSSVNEYEYNNQGWMLSQTSMDAEGNLLSRNGDPARTEYQYDKSGRRIAETCYDAEGKEYALTRDIMEITGVREAGQAALAGIQTGDLLMKYGGWEIFDYNNITEIGDMLGAAIQENMDTKKILVIGRENEEGEDLMFSVIEMGPGIVDIRMQSASCSDVRFEEIREQYRTWKEENNM